MGRLARERGATVVYGAFTRPCFLRSRSSRKAHAVVKGDGDVAWGQVLATLKAGNAKRIWRRGKIERREFLGGALGPDADG